MPRPTSPYPRPLGDPAIPVTDWSADNWQSWWWAFRRRGPKYQEWRDKEGHKLPSVNPYVLSERGDAESHCVSEKIFEALEHWGCLPVDYQQSATPLVVGGKGTLGNQIWVGPDLETELLPKPKIVEYGGLTIAVHDKPPTLKLNTPEGETLSLDRSKNLRTQLAQERSRLASKLETRNRLVVFDHQPLSSDGHSLDKAWRSLEKQLRRYWPKRISRKKNRPPRRVLRRYLEILDLTAAGRSQFQIADALNLDDGSLRKMRKKARALASDPSRLVT